MSDDVDYCSAQEQRLQEALADYLRAAEAGNPPERKAFLAHHPELAGELEAYFAGEERFERLAAPVRSVLTALQGASFLQGMVGAPGILGDFRVLREVGRGGMGIVYKAEQISLGRRVALKVLPFASTLDPKQLQRFHNEAKAAACLHHEHIIPVYFVGCEHGVHFYAMQFIDGNTLAQLMEALRADEGCTAAGAQATQDYHPAKDAPTPPVAALSTERSGSRGRAFYRQAAELIAQAAGALEHAHGLGIVHRDIKPANLLIDQVGKLWVGDFGLARLGADAGLTVSGDLLGTLRYMAPEQALARHGLVDHRADVYALGATLYELLTLRPAVTGSERAEILRQVAFDEPTAPRKLDRTVPVELETVALKCLAKNPDERYPTAGELAEDLRRWLDDKPVKAKPPSLGQRLAKWSKRHLALAALSLAVLLLAVVGLTVGLLAVEQERRRTAGALAAEAKRRQQTRQALDLMSSALIKNWLSKQKKLLPEHQAFLEQALAWYEEFAAEVGPDEEVRAGVARAYGRIGDIQERLGHPERAELAFRRRFELFRQLAADFPAVPAYRHELAKRLGHLGELQGEAGRREAVRLLRQLVAEFPATPEYRRDLAIAVTILGTQLGQSSKAEQVAAYRESIALMRQLVADFPSVPEYCVQLAARLTDLGNVLRGPDSTQSETVYREAMTLLQPLASDFHTDLEFALQLSNLHCKLGLVFRSTGRRAEAAEAFRESLVGFQRLSTDFPGVKQYREEAADKYRLLGHELAAIGKSAEAGEALRESVAAWRRLAADFPDDPEQRQALAAARYEQGDFLAKVNKPAEAEQSYREALAIAQKVFTDFPTHAGNPAGTLHAACRRLAGLLQNAGRRQEVEAVYHQLIDSLPQHAFQVADQRANADVVATNYRLFGYLLAHVGRCQEAKDCYRRYLQLAPANARAQNNWAWMLATEPDPELREPAAALELAKKAVELNPTGGFIWNTLGVAHYRNGDWTACVAALEKSMKLRQGNDGFAWFFLAMAYEQLGNKEEARRWYDKAVLWTEEHRPQHEELRRFRAEAATLLGIKDQSTPHQEVAPPKDR